MRAHSTTHQEWFPKSICLREEPRAKVGAFSRDKSWLVLVVVMSLCVQTLLGLKSNARAYRIHPPGLSREVGEGDEVKPSWFAAPYAYHTESWKWAYGLGAMTSGYLQEQSTFFAAVLRSTNSSHGIYLSAEDFQPPGTERLFLNPYFSYARYAQYRAHIDGNPDFIGIRAGSNDSDPDDFIERSTREYWWEMKFRYVLPVGRGRDRVISRFELDRGLLVRGASGGDSWNPFQSGKTLIEIMPAYRKQQFDDPLYPNAFETSYLEGALLYDNRDYPVNPSRGSYQRIVVARDFGWSDEGDTWTLLEGEASKYFSLPTTKYFRQNVLALNLWTAYTPTAEFRDTELGQNLIHAPPFYMGATLGGFYRMRGFPEHRFRDRAAIYYGAEFRSIPKWHPLGNIPWLRFLDMNIDWWQWVAILEAGRVAPHWDISELHSNMKWDGGFGLRLMVDKAVVRLDTCFSDEGWAVYAMVEHPW